MDPELVTQLLSGAGPIGLLAYFALSRLAQSERDAREHIAKTDKEHHERLVGLLEAEKGRTELLVRVVQDNTAALTALRTSIDERAA